MRMQHCLVSLLAPANAWHCHQEERAVVIFFLLHAAHFCPSNAGLFSPQQPYVWAMQAGGSVTPDLEDTHRDEAGQEADSAVPYDRHQVPPRHEPAWLWYA